MTDDYSAYLEEQLSVLKEENKRLVEQRNWLISEMEKAGCELISLPGTEAVVENTKVDNIRIKLLKMLPETKVKEVIYG